MKKKIAETVRMNIFILLLLLFLSDARRKKSLVEKYVELYEADDRMESILVTAEKNARKRPNAFESQAFLALTLQRSERLNKIGKGYGGLASKRMKRALKAFQKSHELIEHASSNLDRGILYVKFISFVRKRKSRPSKHTGTRALRCCFESPVIYLKRKMQLCIMILRPSTHLNGIECGSNKV